MKRFVGVLLAVACSGGSNEQCENGKDDDGNGKVDCADSACTTNPACAADAGFWGSCAKCGQACTKQQQCFGVNLLDDRPMPVCGPPGKCQLFNQDVQVNIQYDTSTWTAANPAFLGVVSTRWISKTGIDGGAVTCASVRAAAPSTAAADALQLEASGAFNELGFDVTPRGNGSIPNPLLVRFVHVGTGSDFLVYSEAWSGNRDSTTHQPNGLRQSTGCVESGAEVAPLTAASDCSSDAGTCRTLMLPLPAP